MLITRKVLSGRLISHLGGEVSLAALVEWAENSVFEGDFEPGYEELLMDILCYVGAADVPGFELDAAIAAEFLRRLADETPAGLSKAS